MPKAKVIRFLAHCISFFKRPEILPRLGVLLLLMVFIGAGSIVYFFPLQMAQWRSSWSLRLAGVSEITLDAGGVPIHAYLRDRCSSSLGSNGASDCYCVALIHGQADDALTWERLLVHDWESTGGEGAVEIPGMREGVVSPQKTLARPLKLVALNLPGSGGSPFLSNDQNRSHSSTSHRASDLASLLLKALRPLCSQWTVVGHDFGGWIGVWMGLEGADQVAQLVLMSPDGFRFPSSVAPYFSAPTPGSMEGFYERAYAHLQPMSDRLKHQMVQAVLAGPVQARISAQKPEDYYESRLSHLRSVTLFLWGTEDKIIPVEQGHWMRELLHHAIWKEISGCGHFLQKECPREVISTIIDLSNHGLM